MKSGHAALLSTTEPGSGWRSELEMFLPPTLSLHLHLVLALPTAIPFPFSLLSGWRTHIGWSWSTKGCPWGREAWGWGEPWSDCLRGSGKNSLELLLHRSLRAHSSLILCQDAAASGVYHLYSLEIPVSLVHAGIGTGSNFPPSTQSHPAQAEASSLSPALSGSRNAARKGEVRPLAHPFSSVLSLLRKNAPMPP